MKYTYNIIALLVTLVSLSGCVDDVITEENKNSDKEFNIDEFSEGYSLSFDINLDRMGGAETRADDSDDALLIKWENALEPEEFRVLFFNADNQFLFESKTRWLTETGSTDGGKRWRVGVPVFAYLSDNYDDTKEEGDFNGDESYNWDKITEYMRTQSFKVVILANRPSNINLPNLSDLDNANTKVKTFGINGPFWTAQNSVASYENPDAYSDVIKTVFDLHHCQYDPIYENKNNTGDCYGFIMEYLPTEVDDGSKANLPNMGAVSSWIHSKRVYDGNSGYYYKLPEGQILEQTNKENVTKDPDQWIPMYGIQEFGALSEWTKGTTFNISEQVGSQTGEYIYKTIFLLRSVVRLELRIPMYDKDGYPVSIDNKNARIVANNYMARCEPMDVLTPTNEIWNENHSKDCEWLSIRNYGLYADGGKSGMDYKKRLSWFYGTWKEAGWDFKGQEVASETATTPYPRIFNPITQRLQSARITDCFLPIGAYKKNSDGLYEPDDAANGLNSLAERKKWGQRFYYRWVVYCGEKHINDLASLNDVTSTGYVSFFRVKVKRTVGSTTKEYVYNLPVTDYSKENNPIFKKDETQSYLVEEGGDITLDTYPAYMTDYYSAVTTLASQTNGYELFPYPLLRNHVYRLTVSFGDGEDINVQGMDAEQRHIGGIVFN